MRVKNLRHGRTRNKSALLRQSALCKIPSRVLGVRYVYIGNNVNDTPVGLLGQAFVLTAVARLHVKNRNVKPFCRNRGKTAVRIAENQQSVGHYLVHKLIRRGNYITH